MKSLPAAKLCGEKGLVAVITACGAELLEHVACGDIQDLKPKTATLTKMDPLLLSKMEPGGESVLSRFWGLGAEV